MLPLPLLLSWSGEYSDVQREERRSLVSSKMVAAHVGLQCFVDQLSRSD